jgi:hypothetical protein
VRNGTGLRIATAFLIITRFSLVNTGAQTALTKTWSTDPSARETAKIDEDISRNEVVVLKSSVEEESKLSSARAWSPSPTALSSQDPRKLGVLDQAYLDAFTILNDDNSCSRFFGGRYAISALTELVHQLKPTYLEAAVAIRMSGPITTVQSNRTGFSFRLFQKAELNLAGSFFHSGRSSVASSLLPNTRETRVVVLLHELGHLVKSPEAKWVLPDDGSSQSQSLANTQRVVSVWREQIDSLSHLSAEHELEIALLEVKPGE